METVSPFICDFKHYLQQARAAVLTMLEESDRSKWDELTQTIAHASHIVDTALQGLQEKFPEEERLKALEQTWVALKRTRDGEIVPAIYAGEKAKAQELALGIQVERLATLHSLLKELGADLCK